eukprot:GHVL01041317.1.p1 GENE.GHVL01041317.1~~GHVL01041317.1.p1  ORF type:complete len:153 (+),score=27.49 GHVL01041317.1:870-1328(+)
MLPMTLMPKKGAHMRSSCEIPLGGEVAERHSGLIQECLAKLNCKERERMYTKECVLVRSALKNDILAAAQLERLIKCKQEDIAALQDFIRGRTDDELGGAGENIGPAGVGGKTGGAFIKGNSFGASKRKVPGGSDLIYQQPSSSLHKKHKSR